MDIIEILNRLNEQHDNAIAVLGGAYHASIYTQGDEPDLTSFVMCLLDVVEKARFFEWHEGVVGALNRFCHLCLVDPPLIELYIGMTFEEVAER